MNDGYASSPGSHNLTFDSFGSMDDFRTYFDYLEMTRPDIFSTQEIGRSFEGKKQSRLDRRKNIVLFIRRDILVGRQNFKMNFFVDNVGAYLRQLGSWNSLVE